MVKKYLMALVAIIVLWTILDFVIHGVILKSAYAASRELWRPEMEMKMGLMYVVYILSALPFITVFERFFSHKTTKNGLLYGVLTGFAAGVSMGYGSYCVMPIPYYMAFTWFFGSWVEMALAGMLVGLIFKDS